MLKPKFLVNFYIFTILVLSVNACNDNSSRSEITPPQSDSKISVLTKHVFLNSLDKTVLRYNVSEYNSNGVPTKQVFYWSEGSDGVWFSADDTPLYYYSFEYDKDIKINEIHYSGPGLDDIWYTADDEIDYYINYGSNQNNDSIEMIQYLDAGEDLSWFTDDDVVSYYRIKNENTELIRRIGYDGAGEDGLWFTEDDEPSFYKDYILDDNKNTVREVRYYDSGEDLTWFTSDDLVTVKPEAYFYDVKNRLKETVLVDSPGTDKIYFTNDDIKSKVKYEYNEEGDLASKDISYSAGDDGIYFTDDDYTVRTYKYSYNQNKTLKHIIHYSFRRGYERNLFNDQDISSYISYLYDDEGSLLNVKQVVNSGGDGVWFTDDDIYNEYEEYSTIRIDSSPQN